jgi:uncharacterized protein
VTARRAGIQLALEDGTDLADKINPRLISLSLTEQREGEADEIDIRLQNADGLLQIPEPGAVLTLAMGWTSGDDVPVGMVGKGRFTVDEVGQEGPPDVVTFKGRSADMTGQLRQRRTKTWRDTTLGSILRAIAGRHGRSARVEAALAGLAIAVIEQEGKSDLAFVADLGRRYDAVATWKDGRLLFLPIGAAATASGQALAALTLTKRDVGRWTFSQAERESYDGAEAQWQDQDAGRRRTVTTGGDNRRKLKRVYASEAEARQAAEAATKRAGRAPYRFSCELAIGDPALQPDMKVALQGWGAKIDGVSWLVESVRTDFGAQGLHQSVELESA